MDNFETRVRKRSAFTVGPQLAMCGGFRDVMHLQTYASGWCAPPSTDGVKQMALYFGIPIPPGYGTAAEKAA